ncbi:NADAR family protein [Galbibacter sp. BG1]|uniref:NADAR family protein n=1 Tax=Galbibacter sp. BG1 TaxID=1170699 RepID=UPI001C7098CD|nr:NADAR family protein [Galbibacter sp. BG1]
MIKLTEKQLRDLSRQERYNYYNDLRNYEWSLLTNEEKKQSILDDHENFINKRGVEGITLEEQIVFALKNELSAKSKYVTSLVKHYSSIKNIEKFTFFWETTSPFSQWHKSKFTASTCLIQGVQMNKLKREYVLQNQFPSDVQEYSSAEQFMMYHKAIIFLDVESAKKIMSTNNVRKIKELGRNVSGFNEEVWRFYRSQIVLEGNRAKFEQNLYLKEELLKTRGTTLVEASPNDNIWGIGLKADNIKAYSRETWEGLNLLGEILTILRIEFDEEY